MSRRSASALAFARAISAHIFLGSGSRMAFSSTSGEAVENCRRGFVGRTGGGATQWCSSVVVRMTGTYDGGQCDEGVCMSRALQLWRYKMMSSGDQGRKRKVARTRHLRYAKQTGRISNRKIK